MFGRTGRSLLDELFEIRHNVRESFRQKQISWPEIVTLVRFTAEMTNTQFGRIVKVNTGAFLGLALVHFAMMFVAFQITYIRLYQQIILVVFSLPVTVWVFCGLLRFYVTVYRNKPLAFRLHLPGLRAYTNIMLFCLIYYGLYVLLVKVVLNFRDYNGIIQIRIVLGLLVFLWIQTRLLFVPLLIIRQNITLRDAINASYQMTSKRTTKTLMLFFVFFLIFTFGIVSLIVGVIYTLSMAMLGYVAVFNHYKSEQHASPYWELPDTRPDEAVELASEPAPKPTAATVKKAAREDGRPKKPDRTE